MKQFDPMGALKWLVIVLGVLIFLSFVLLFYGFVKNLLGPGASDNEETTSVAPPIPSTFGIKRLELPSGCNVVDMRPDGARLYLRTGPAGICEQIIIVDTATGDKVGTIMITP